MPTDSLITCNNNLSNVKSTKFLGLIIDDTLNWHLHVEFLLKRLSKAIYVLRYLKYFLYVETLKIIYFAQIHSLIRYGIIFWGNSAGGSRVFHLQKKILRIICNLKPRDTCLELFPKMQVMTFYSLYIYSLILFAINNGDLFPVNSEIHKHNTRINNSLHFSKLRLTKVKKGPYNSCIRAYNHLPNTIKALSFNSMKFKIALKKFLYNIHFILLRSIMNLKGSQWFLVPMRKIDKCFIHKGRTLGLAQDVGALMVLRLLLALWLYFLK